MRCLRCLRCLRGGQSEFCGGFRGYNLAFLLSAETAARDVAAMMRRAGYADPALEPSYQYHFAPGGMHRRLARAGTGENAGAGEHRYLTYFTLP